MEREFCADDYRQIPVLCNKYAEEAITDEPMPGSSKRMKNVPYRVPRDQLVSKLFSSFFYKRAKIKVIYSIISQCTVSKLE